MTTEQNKAVARRWVEAFEKCDKAGLESLAQPNIVDHTAVPGLPDGLEGIQAQAELYTTAFPDIRFTTKNVVAEGDRVAITWMAGGTNTGPLQGMPLTGKQAFVLGCNLMHVVDGKVTEHWVYFDRLALMMQLGATPTPQVR
jgi:predicted ester cyclase